MKFFNIATGEEITKEQARALGVENVEVEPEESDESQPTKTAASSSSGSPTDGAAESPADGTAVALPQFLQNFQESGNAALDNLRSAAPAIGAVAGAALTGLGAGKILGRLSRKPKAADAAWKYIAHHLPERKLGGDAHIKQFSDMKEDLLGTSQMREYFKNQGRWRGRKSPAEAAKLAREKVMAPSYKENKALLDIVLSNDPSVISSVKHLNMEDFGTFMQARYPNKFSGSELEKLYKSVQAHPIVAKDFSADMSVNELNRLKGANRDWTKPQQQTYEENINPIVDFTDVAIRDRITNPKLAKHFDEEGTAYGLEKFLPEIDKKHAIAEDLFAGFRRPLPPFSWAPGGVAAAGVGGAGGNALGKKALPEKIKAEMEHDAAMEHALKNPVIRKRLMEILSNRRTDDIGKTQRGKA